MGSSIDILNELKLISPVIASIEKVNPFTVPAGYFEQLDKIVLINVKAENGFLFDEAISPKMDVPAGYFDSLANNILDKIKAQETVSEELNKLSPLLHGIPGKNVFTVPQGYFEALATTVLAKINTIDAVSSELNELSPVLAGISNKNVFTVPEGYFESLTKLVLNNISTTDPVSSELNELSPVLAGIPNRNVFTVPNGYFETFPARMTATVQPPQSKLVSMATRTRTILKYAVAAAFTGVMALGVYKFSVPVKPGVPPVLAIVPSYVDSGQKIKNVDEELAKVSDDDIIKYLQVNGTDVDAALVASSVNEKDLPSQEDYLTDDKALDKFLDNVDVKDLKN